MMDFMDHLSDLALPDLVNRMSIITEMIKEMKNWKEQKVLMAGETLDMVIRVIHSCRI